MKEIFAIVPNVTRAFGTKYYLTEFEVNVYVAIRLYRNFCLDNTSITSVKLIHRYMNLSENNYRKDSTKIVDSLNALHDKKYIKITCDGDIKKDILEIKILEMESASIEVKFGDKTHTYKGFEKVSLRRFEACENTYLHAFLHVVWRSGLKDYRISFKEFAFVLNKSDKQAERIVNEAVKLEIFYKESGSYTFENAVVRQEPNKYNIKPKANLEEKVKEVKSMDFKEKNKKNITDEKISSNPLYLSMLFEKENFTYEAYSCFKETTCSYVKEKFEKKIAIISKNENGKYAIDKLEKQYQADSEYRRMQKETYELRNNQLDNMSDEELEREFPYLLEDEELEKKRQAERRKRKQEEYDRMKKMFD